MCVWCTNVWCTWAILKLFDVKKIYEEDTKSSSKGCVWWIWWKKYWYDINATPVHIIGRTLQTARWQLFMIKHRPTRNGEKNWKLKQKEQLFQLFKQTQLKKKKWIYLLFNFSGSSHSIGLVGRLEKAEDLCRWKRPILAKVWGFKIFWRLKHCWWFKYFAVTVEI